MFANVAFNVTQAVGKQYCLTVFRQSLSWISTRRVKRHHEGCEFHGGSLGLVNGRENDKVVANSAHEHGNEIRSRAVVLSTNTHLQAYHERK